VTLYRPEFSYQQLGECVASIFRVGLLVTDFTFTFKYNSAGSILYNESALVVLLQRDTSSKSSTIALYRALFF
jgi:uncharacterized membrane protein